MDNIDTNQLAQQYQPLVYKIVNQWTNKLPLAYEDILGYAEEGLAIAINSYDPKKRNKHTGKVGQQGFKQYAAWCMRHTILNGSNTEGHIVKFSAYQQKKRKEEGSNTFIMKSIDINYDDNGDMHCNIPEMGAEDPYVGLTDVYDRLYQKIERKFSKRDCDIFYRTMGLKDRDQEQNKLIAKRYKLAPCTITFINKQIITYIKADQELCDELYELLS